MEVILYLWPLWVALLFSLGLGHAIFWGMTYTVDTGHVRVRVYGGTVRKVALADIEWAAQDWVFWNEHWTNTVHPKKLVLLRRRTGWCQHFIISPASPQAFLAELAAQGVPLR